MKIIGKVQCLIFGHRRGQKWGTPDEEAKIRTQVYRCPRCHATWRRKAKAAA